MWRFDRVRLGPPISALCQARSKLSKMIQPCCVNLFTIALGVDLLHQCGIYSRICCTASSVPLDTRARYCCQHMTATEAQIGRLAQLFFNFFIRSFRFSLLSYSALLMVSCPKMLWMTERTAVF